METIIVILVVTCVIEAAFIMKLYGDKWDAINDSESLLEHVIKLQEINENLTKEIIYKNNECQS